mmetsp:Transcript_2480/g.5652  ORF Transcript_2480/g.5652 Transcript_2480/m.5652 type:complete len:104 (+) Transcript_2480:65-376(+)
MHSTFRNYFIPSLSDKQDTFFLYLLLLDRRRMAEKIKLGKTFLKPMASLTFHGAKISSSFRGASLTINLATSFGIIPAAVVRSVLPCNSPEEVMAFLDRFVRM